VVRGFRCGDRYDVYPGGAALVRDENVMVVADLHLGCEAALEYEGLSLPRVQTRRIEATLCDLLESVGPTRLVVAGDLKHNFSRNLVQEWEDVTRFVRTIAGIVDLEVVKGNHDNYLVTILRESGIPLCSDVRVGGVNILHGHRGSAPTGPVVMGHIHRLWVRTASGTVKVQCHLHDPERDILVLPAMSLVASGVDVVHVESADTISPLLEDVGLGPFRPIVASGRQVLRFPDISRMRAAEDAGIE
jgi:putative SbcD/Mre11-related phosphoesterase